MKEEDGNGDFSVSRSSFFKFKNPFFDGIWISGS